MAKYQCPDCEYIYDEVAGHPHEGFPPGTSWETIPEEWACPDCAVRDKADFVVIESGSASPASGAATPEVRTATTPPKAEASPQKSTGASTPSTNNKAKAKAKAKPARAKSSKDSTGKETTFRKWICITCGHIYDDSLGDETEGFAPGTLFEDIPDDWCCPDCGATKEDYVLHED
jgi:rubredoxin